MHDMYVLVMSELLKAEAAQRHRHHERFVPRRARRRHGPRRVT